MTNDDPIAKRFAAWRDEFTGRRTVPWEMLDQATHLIQASQEYHARQARATVAGVEERLAAVEQQHVRELERAAEREARALDRAERAEASEKAYRAQQTNLRERRESIEDGVQVRISAPRVSTYGDRTAPRPWTLGELEDVIYRLRSGGATDDTEVRVKHEHTEACIPFPEMVLEPRRTTPVSTPARVPRVLVPFSGSWWLRAGAGGLVGAVVVLAAKLFGVLG